jgi:hypothetical protein
VWRNKHILKEYHFSNLKILTLSNRKCFCAVSAIQSPTKTINRDRVDVRNIETEMTNSGESGPRQLPAWPGKTPPSPACRPATSREWSLPRSRFIRSRQTSIPDRRRSCRHPTTDRQAPVRTATSSLTACLDSRRSCRTVSSGWSGRIPVTEPVETKNEHRCRKKPNDFWSNAVRSPLTGSLVRLNLDLARIARVSPASPSLTRLLRRPNSLNRMTIIKVRQILRIVFLLILLISSYKLYITLWTQLLSWQYNFLNFGKDHFFY